MCGVASSVCVCGVVYVVPSKGVSGPPCANTGVISNCKKSTSTADVPHFMMCQSSGVGIVARMALKGGFCSLGSERL